MPNKDLNASLINASKKRNFLLPFISPQSPPASGAQKILIHENTVGDEQSSVQFLSHNASISSIVSTFRSDRTKKTLNQIKDQKLRTERSLQ